MIERNERRRGKERVRETCAGGDPHVMGQTGPMTCGRS